MSRTTDTVIERMQDKQDLRNLLRLLIFEALVESSEEKTLTVTQERTLINKYIDEIAEAAGSNGI